MRKIAIMLLAFIAVLAVILFLKVNRTIPNKVDTPNHSDIASQNSSTYSDGEIKALILKGKDNLNNMENVYYERWNTKFLINKIYYKTSKMKRELYSPSAPNEKLRTVIEIDGKEYDISHTSKSMSISSKESNKIYYGFQADVIEKAHSSVYEFAYLRDEKLDEKDCILVEEIYHGSSESLKSFLEDLGNYIYWIEKSTGFVIGDGRITQSKDNLTLKTVYRNISIGTVQDNIFEIPAGYKIR